MKKIILNIAVSLDGYIAGPNREIDWLFTDQDYGFTEFYNSVDKIIMGRKSYDKCLEFDEWYYKGKDCYVITSSKSYTDNDKVKFVNTDLESFVNKVKNESVKDIWLLGGGMLISSFLDLDLIDEMILSIHPVLLGKGIPLVQNLRTPKNFITKSVKTFETGLVQIAYSK
ncbi:MAG: dihydrofolate reductase family protein [Ignavibacteria bacterium]|jgi:dihydrofolate reductase